MTEEERLRQALKQLLAAMPDTRVLLIAKSCAEAVLEKRKPTS